MKFMTILLASVFNFFLLVIMNIITDSIAQNPAISDTFKNLIQSPVADTLSLIIEMICAAVLNVGPIALVAMFIRSRRETT